jgi:dUTP pyrophosphatase
VLNAPGTIDWDYPGEVGVILYNSDLSNPYEVTKGDRIAQIVFKRADRVYLQTPDGKERTDTPAVKRTAEGFGSTGV